MLSLTGQTSEYFSFVLHSRLEQFPVIVVVVISFKLRNWQSFFFPLHQNFSAVFVFKNKLTKKIWVFKKCPARPAVHVPGAANTWITTYEST